ncbi:MAG: ferric reductase-like transmembrane domain-containing protein, partial [Actinomycetota bacterium]|nr:ferric reductase-like transmembrane domain-containing protein [Actinomycetota bacterium]
SAYWYLSRGTGVVSLLLLTASVILGVLGSLRFAIADGWPRFTIDSLHRDVSLLVIVVLVVHILTSVLDSFAPISLSDSVIPLVASYRPIWMGLGALGFDLVVALVVTSLVRRRLGYQAWRAIHWLAYVSWPVSVLHGLGTGSDVKSWWMLLVTAACVAAVLVAVGARLVRLDRAHAWLHAPGAVLLVLTPLGLGVFTFVGPLAHGWARRAGTPASLLPRTFVAARSSAPKAPGEDTLRVPFTASLSGTVTQTQVAGGAIVNLALAVGGGAHGILRIRLGGAPDAAGGVSMTGSQVDLVASGLASVAQGRVVSLRGQRLVARVRDTSGSALYLHASLNIDQNTGAVSGTLSGSATAGGSQ